MDAIVDVVITVDVFGTKFVIAAVAMEEETELLPLSLLKIDVFDEVFEAPPKMFVSELKEKVDGLNMDAVDAA